MDPDSGMDAEPGMAYTHTGKDDSLIAFQTSLKLHDLTPDPRRQRLILLIHGFGGSSSYFKHNFAALAASSWVLAVDLRGHGRSARTRGGHSVAVLAADLQRLVQFIRSQYTIDNNGDDVDFKIVAVGCSLGAAVLWTYTELFGDGDFAGFVFVDQAPLQDVSFLPLDDPWGREKAHTGCYDEATLLAAQRAWVHAPADAHRALVRECLGYRVSPRPEKEDTSPERVAADEAFFTSISARCDGQWLAPLLADHTRRDHRDALAGISKPVLVIAGRRTGCFPVASIEEVARRINAGRRASPPTTPARFELFEGGHWMFYEEPERFNKVVGDFAEDCMGGRRP